MAQIVGVRFKRAGRIYYFDPVELDLNVNDIVVVETVRGLEAGWVVIAPKQVLASELSEPLKPILRKASPEELVQMDEFKRKEREVLAQCEEKVAQFNMPMKLISAEYNLDGSRLTIYFSAEARVDFRELVRELANTFKTRVELRQVGARDGAKLTGGLGRCGCPLCCTSFLTEFATVSIKMAKEQDLPLNPMKISGICGRLLCCLGYENEFYNKMRESLPSLGETVMTPVGEGKVLGCNVIKETVTVQLESQATIEVPLDELRLEGKAGKQKRESEGG